jgi:hypothetical protein
LLALVGLMMKPGKIWQTHFFLETFAASLRPFDLIRTDSKEFTCPQNRHDICAPQTI